MIEKPLLELDGFGVAFGERVVLASVDLRLAARGLTLLVGPSGSGKSTLLRTLSGHNGAQPALRTWGHASYACKPLIRASERPSLVMQHARFLTASVRENLVSQLPDRHCLSRAEQDAIVAELLAQHRLPGLLAQLDQDAVSLPTSVQRRLAILAAVVARPALVMVDEPTSGVDDDEARDIVALLQQQAEQRAVLLVTHHQAHAQHAGGEVALLAGGRVLERAPTASFFAAPQTPAGADFVRTGGCIVPSPMARADELADGVSVPALPRRARSPQRRTGPRGFRWLHPGRLGGLSRPGLLDDVERDLDALCELGVNVLVCLEEEPTVELALLQRRGIESHHLATRDMGVASLEDVSSMCGRIAAWLDAGRVVAVHCKAGLGRTGTTLACQLIWEGETALRAIERARRIHPMWIQSEAQAAFLIAFWTALTAHDLPRGLPRAAR